MFTKETKSSGGVVVNPQGEILVVNQNGDSWSLPKGHIEKGEDPINAVKREILEESGIKNLTFIKPLGSYKRYKIGPNGVGEDMSELKQIEMFLFQTKETNLEPKDPTIPEARWVSADKVANVLTHEKDKDFFQKILFELKNIKN